MNSALSSTSIIVPFRPDGAERDRNWAWVKDRYQTLHSDWEIVEGRCRPGEWCKGEAVADALEEATGEYLVMSDADIWLDDSVMREGARRLADSPWVVPHERTFRLTEQATRDFISGQLGPHQLTHDHLSLPARRGTAGGGLFFIRRDAYLSAGGFDERFRGWGGEDEALGMALEALFGPPVRLGSILVHLHHEPQPDMPEHRRRPGQVELVGEYEAARGSADAMCELLERR